MLAEYSIPTPRQLMHIVSTTACTLSSSLCEENVQNMLHYSHTCWNWAFWAYDWAYWIFGPSVFIFFWVFLCLTGLIYPVKLFFYGIFYGIWIALCLAAGKIWKLLQYMRENRSGIVKWFATRFSKVSVPATINVTAGTPVVEPLPVTLPVRTPPVVPDQNQYPTSAMTRVVQRRNGPNTRQQTDIAQPGTMPQPKKKSSMAQQFANLNKSRK